MQVYNTRQEFVTTGADFFSLTKKPSSNNETFSLVLLQWTFHLTFFATVVTLKLLHYFQIKKPKPGTFKASL